MEPLKRTFLVPIVLLAAVAWATAQAPIGSIEGTVIDASGAVLPGAKVTITELGTGRVISLTTTSAGIYAARALPPGRYKLHIAAENFRAFEIPEVVVEAGKVVDGSSRLEVGTATQMVEVSASPVQVNTSTATVAGVITATQIDQLPLDARNFLDLAIVEPGVQIADGGNIDPTKSATYRTVQIQGRSGTGTRVQMDGIDVTDETVGTTLANISADAVQEFELSQSTLDLSTSLTSSGAVSIITRSGTNDFHGSGFWFYRNQDMGARLGFNPTSVPFHRTQVGYRVGGPIKKDRAFFFSNWERTYQQEQSSYTSDQNFPNIPFGSSHNCTTGCFAGVPLGIRMFDERIDWDAKSSVRTFFRFGQDWNVSTGGSIPVSPFQNKDQTNMLIAGLDATSSRLSHSFRFGSVYFHNQIVSQNFAGFAFPTVGGTAYNISVGDPSHGYNFGPNGLAPQGTLQHNYQTKYDGSFVFGRHTLRYGLEVNRIILGGFANFAGPLSVSGVFNAANQAAIAKRGDNAQDPLQYPLSDFSMGPANGFFTVEPCFGYAHGCHKNTRIAWYFGDTFRARRNLTLLLGTRWEYDTGYFNDETNVNRPAFLDYWGKGIVTTPKFPKDAFGPQFGFAWDPKGDGKTSIRGGVYVAYEMNIYNNLLFDQFALIPAGIGPDTYSSSYVGQPDGTAITPQVAGVTSLPAPCQTAAATAALFGDNEHTGGDWSCLADPSLTIGQVLPIIGQLNAAVQSAYASYHFDPTKGDPLFVTAKGVTFGYLVGGSRFKIPYSTQMNLGFQREIKPGHVLSADFIYNHGVGLPFLGEDLECRRCAKTLNVAAARAKVNSVLNGMAVDQWMAANPGVTIGAFGLASDSIFRGLTPDPNSPYPEIQSTNFLRARVMTRGGFTKYKGLQIQMIGHFAQGHGPLLRHAQYIGSWAISSSEATNGAYRTEFLNLAQNKLNPRDPHWFGPVSEDRRHIVTGGILWDTLGGFRLSQLWHFTTAGPLGFTIPELGIAGSSAIFTTDRTGSGSNGGGSPFDSLIPGLDQNQFGRGVNGRGQLNLILSNYNNTVAGTLTPAGQALVNAGIFTPAQLVALGAVSPKIPLVPATNPWPFNNLINLDLGISRPTKLFTERVTVEPWLQIFNVFNDTGYGSYGTLGATFGSLNYPYQPSDIPALTSQRQRISSTRLMQIGVRVTF
ncbi:MAG: hypothetical protein DMG27_16740 [Acidobacteria bacterium]|nr:MAG: hypothetical protein DMG27_16740 [Acidobacteriota bacterium]